VASAVNDATREVGGALGIALAGSILAGSYSHHITAGLTAFPSGVRGPASDSLTHALTIANQPGPQGNQLAEVGKNAFVAAMNSSFLAMAAVVGIAAVVVPLFAPGRDDEQLRARATRSAIPRPRPLVTCVMRSARRRSGQATLPATLAVAAVPTLRS
jgi:hypothetical protein